MKGKVGFGDVRNRCLWNYVQTQRVISETEFHIQTGQTALKVHTQATSSLNVRGIMANMSPGLGTDVLVRRFPV